MLNLMVQKMDMELQRDIIRKIILKRGSPSAQDIDAFLDYVDSTKTLPENIEMLESEGFLLPVPFEEMGEYLAKQSELEQEELEEAEQREKHNRIVNTFSL